MECKWRTIKPAHFVTIHDPDWKLVVEASPSPGQRPITEVWIEFLIEESKRGTFHDPSIALCKLDGAYYISDGQHAREVIRRTGDRHGCVLTVYEAKSALDAGELCGSFINKGHRPGIANMIVANGAGLVGNATKRIIDTVVSAVAIVEITTPYSAPSMKRALLLQRDDVKKFCVWWNNVSKADSVEADHVHLVGVTAAAFRTWNVAQKASAEFWGEVVSGIGLAEKSGSKKLRDRLLRSAREIGRRSKAAMREQQVLSLHAWNAWRKSKPVDHLKYLPDQPMPEPE